MPRAVSRASAVFVAVVVAALPSAASAAVVPETVAGPEVAEPSFTVRYTGASRTSTQYRATPPNPGGGPDRNTANDTGRTSWTLDYPMPVVFPTCTAVDDRCGATTGVDRASGRLRASGVIRHKHVDGLYRQLDSKAACTVKATGVPKRGIQARVEVVHDTARGGWIVTAFNPVGDALVLLPQACRDPVDGIDRILGNYFWPGFSLSGNDGPERWFTSESVVIPESTWRTSRRIRLRLGPKAVNRPPRDCAKRFKYERCRTSGSWSGVLTFSRVGG